MSVDPRTGKPLPADAIQRVLYVCKAVHVYAIPPLRSMKGYEAASWTTPGPDGKTSEIFTARLRVLETAVPTPPTPAPRVPMRPLMLPEESAEPGEEVQADIVLEEPETGALFAAAPYVEAGVVEHAVDSSRFFAIRVVGEGKKAVLGIGFEDRSEAFDFGVALQEARKILRFEVDTGDAIPPAARNVSPAPRTGGRGPAGGGTGGRLHPSPAASPRGSRVEVPQRQRQQQHEDNKTRDYSLKPGETIATNPGSRPRSAETASQAGESDEKAALFSILPPPPSTSSRRQQQQSVNTEAAADGDDDEFGDFQ